MKPITEYLSDFTIPQDLLNVISRIQQEAYEEGSKSQCSRGEVLMEAAQILRNFADANGIVGGFLFGNRLEQEAAATRKDE